MIKSRITPILRFKGYTTELEQARFGKVVESNLYGPRFNAEDYSEQGNVKTIRGTDLGKDGEIKYHQVPLARLDEKTIENHRLIDGDIVMITTADCGSTGVFRKQEVDYLSSAYGVRVRLNEMGYPYYFKYFFQTRWAKKEINSFIRKATVANLPGSDILRIKLYLPTFPEQQKIASFLSSIDQKINQLKQKKELLEQYKKGVMQELFSGKLRFKDDDGKEYPEWEKKYFEDIFSFLTTNSFSRENLNLESGTVKNIHYGDIHTKFSSQFNIQEEQVPYINQNIDLLKLKNEVYCQEGDLIIADASEDYKDIGKSIELINLNKEKVVAGLHTFLARPNKFKLHKGFIGYLVQAPYVRKQIMTIAQGTKVLSLSYLRLGKIRLEIPILEEQEKVASFLYSIDIKIKRVTTQITENQIFKKGLLQQMFV